MEPKVNYKNLRIEAIKKFLEDHSITIGHIGVGDKEWEIIIKHEIAGELRVMVYSHLLTKRFRYAKVLYPSSFIRYGFEYIIKKNWHNIKEALNRSSYSNDSYLNNEGEKRTFTNWLRVMKSLPNSMTLRTANENADIYFNSILEDQRNHVKPY